MKKRCVLGYDLNDKACQISVYNQTKDEPDTLENPVEGSKIPLIIGYAYGEWVYGMEAKRLEIMGEIKPVKNLLSKAMQRKRFKIDGEIYDGIWLLAKFISLTLERFSDVEQIAFTTPETSIDVLNMLKGIGRHIGVEKDKIHVLDYKESFCQYMFHQPKELWQYESALFFCDGQQIKAYMLRRLHTGNSREKQLYVAVDEVANVHVQELEAIYPILGDELKVRNADERFKKIIQGVFEKKVVSSVYLTGDGFENNWYPASLKVLCNGRRAFAGNNLYSKGACYFAESVKEGKLEGPIYLDETKLTEQISVRMRVKGKECWYPIATWGTRWYEADQQWEVLLEDTKDLELHIESLTGDDLKVESISLEGLEERTDYSLRLQMELIFLEENVCRITLRDIGFGEFYPASDFYVEKEIQLGGINGQFNSMS